MRALRLGIGLYFGIKSVQTPLWLLGLIAPMFMVQAVNIGCCDCSSVVCRLAIKTSPQMKI